MTLDDRIKQLELIEKTAKPRLRYKSGEARSCIHRLGGELLPTVIVSRNGTYHGGQI